jgi:hypothetical protein
MEFKQSEQKYNENIREVEKKLSPAVLAATAISAQLIAGWLMKNCVEADGTIIDASVPNILRAINALDAAGLIDWEKPPVKKPEKKRPDYLQTREGEPVNHARESRPSEIDIAMGQEKKRREALGDAQNAEIMSEAIALIQRHSSTSHGRTARERDALKKEFDRLVAAKTHPKKLLEAIQAKQEGVYSSSVR